ncbi:TldD/PmbA family protein [Pseudobacteriovorax antillogorgiicola]|uniref:Predicted Zn-dependent protease or its inactivated homolog n=1 Tax=Pseudobacteriovorax antillogorgiicola TaxID=1513793 RepID=A0A1Y6CC92_9BACT|nr:metallopeptidase TldD-related protein [Pseudobacteriovorax antillogorgiicola]TCS48602.1 putative Zn-dependent protease [Pseudobacteriovorax antillogorgiicola]SMF55562.1 Predicted Zn-dependent protease or its inactivated homolog [Pseudobacteriovorax antillogorgiicola]
MQTYFNELVQHIRSLTKGDEGFTCFLEGEDTDFCRFNHGKIRQSGHVLQNKLRLQLFDSQKHMEEVLTLSSRLEDDKMRLEKGLERMRAILKELPKDPYFLLNEEPQSSEFVRKKELPPRDRIIADVLDEVEELDFVGIYAGGDVYRAFANSHGQMNWYESQTFNLDWSVYLQDDKAVKQGYAGFKWEREHFKDKLAQARRQLEVLKRSPKTISPGKYRVYLSPAALEEVFALLNWESFGRKSFETKRSALVKLFDGQERLSPLVSIAEDTGSSIAPNFDHSGFLKPDCVQLIQNGAFASALTCARSAREYQTEANGANHSENPESVAMAPGALEEKDILKELGTGLYINNLWYLNYSDRNACRMTGMTRFASFWVENGEIVAPLNVMRFDESLYRMFGSQLIGLTKDREMILSNSTYGKRDTGSMNLPGALIDDFNLTL